MSLVLTEKILPRLRQSRCGAADRDAVEADCRRREGAGDWRLGERADQRLPDRPGASPARCLMIASAAGGVSAKLKVAGKGVLLETVQGTTSGLLANVVQTWSVQSAGQSKSRCPEPWPPFRTECLAPALRSSTAISDL